MFKAMRILALLGLVLASSTHSSVEATSSRRLARQKVRGLKMKKDDGVPEKKNRFVASLPGEDITRPLPEAIDKFVIDLKPPKEAPAPKLPETQAATLKVHKKNGKPHKHAHKNIDMTDTGLEHFQQGTTKT